MVFYVCGPNEALVKSGAGLAKPNIIAGGYCWVWPCCQQIQKLDLRIMTLDVNSPGVITRQGVPVTVNSVAQVKISKDPEKLSIAAQSFLGLQQKAIGAAAEETLEGHQRSILGALTVEEIFQDREKFADEVLETAVADVASMGLEIVSFTIRDVTDTEGYLHALGLKRIAEVKRDARIGEAEAERDAGNREAETERERVGKINEAETAIADAERKFQLQKAAFDKEVNSEQAKAKMAYELQTAKVKQDIKKEQMEIEVVQRRKQIEVEEQEIIRKGKELEVTIKLPAEAEGYKIRVQAEGQRTFQIKKATAEATSTSLKGQAEADVIIGFGDADATQMTSKAEAWKQYTKGAYIEMIINQLPAMARSVGASLSKAKQITFVSTGEEIGASKLTQEVSNILGQVSPMVQNLTGINLAQEIQRLE